MKHAVVSGTLSTSSKAIRLVLELLGQWSTLEGDGFVGLPAVADDLVVNFTTSSVHAVETLREIAQASPHTKGHFTIQRADGRETYRIVQGQIINTTKTRKEAS